MYGLNALALAFFLGINILAYQLCKCSRHIRTCALRTLCTLLLLGNIFLYTTAYPLIKGEIRLPVEFSTVSYFVVPSILLLNQRQSRSWAAYSGLMAGFFYYLTMIVLGGRIYGSYPPHEVYISLLCHGTLYICGLVTIGTQPCPAKDGYKLVLGTACIGLHAILLRPYVTNAKSLFIYKLLDGDLVRLFLPAESWPVILPIYYAVTALLVLITIKGFFKSSRKQYEKYAI